MSPLGTMEDRGGFASLRQCLPSDPRSEPLACVRKLAQHFSISAFSPCGFMPGEGHALPRLGGKPSRVVCVCRWGVFRKSTGGSHGQSRPGSEPE
jgi:hypothetical protein